ncbi:MAG: SDR family NAD(P)-dependent oxidoreductase [Bacteroidales bacterium]|nr:SDR family NAD(P)-dependent oxidoreductase [Bacteroidales bacterium]
MSCLEFILFFPPVGFNKQKLKEKLKGKNILITGATFGIGANLTYKLAKTGANLILVARTEQKLMAIKKVVEHYGATAQIFAADLYKLEEVDELITNLKKIDGGIDIFISNAGKSIRRSIFKSLDRFHDFTRTMTINYYTPVKLMLSIIPMLQKNKGHVINISAMNVLLTPAPLWAAYQASKTAFDNWFRSVQAELNACNVETTSIYLPLVKTRMILPTKAYRKIPAMTPNHVANIVCKSIITRRKKYAPWWAIFGQISSVLLRRIFEKFTIKNQRKKLIS